MEMHAIQSKHASMSSGCIDAHSSITPEWTGLEQKRPVVRDCKTALFTDSCSSQIRISLKNRSCVPLDIRPEQDYAQVECRLETLMTSSHFYRGPSTS